MSPPPPVGLCLDMCSEQERRERERHRRLHPLEIQNGQFERRNFRQGSHPFADPGRTVKEYSRPAAGRELSSPRDLRPPATLLRTVEYLLMEVWEQVNEQDPKSLSLAYPFVFDRLRAVRQDLTVQRISGTEGASVLEGSLGFLLCAPYLVRDLPLEDYCETLHSTQVRESFAELMECYSRGGRFQRQAEFQALLLLYDLGNLDAMHRTLQLPCSIKNSPEVCLALAINRSYLEKNWVRLLRLVRQLDCLQACAFYRHLPDCRSQAIRTYTHAYSSRNCSFPLGHLTCLLAVDSPFKVSDLCKRRGLVVTSGESEFVLFHKASFKDVDLECPGREIQLVEMKKDDVSWAEVMIGQEMCPV
ncbi:PREDICTED: SAC3 domain-containing protein 1 [Nanorana parkeri]|uniref:SAC3 domain-containing protein 1 n=1 Tax=Nanorana parkeri TaxID=125878 RepID=UPI000854E9B1|nr:PREDICTED: SAC3 domain-containing protein 1 [Nanorana parkeri]